MASIRGRDTKPEKLLRRALWAAGARGWRCHWRFGSGEIDIAFTRRKVAVFVDGAFWHGHPSKWQPGRWQGYWNDKIRRNMDRDKEHTIALENAGWQVLRLWDFDIEAAPDAAAKEVIAALDRVRPPARDRWGPVGPSDGEAP